MTSDITGGVTFMNAAAQVITDWEAAAAQGRAVEDVIRLVASRNTHPPPRGAVAVARQTDQSVDLAGYYLWRAHDGTVLPIGGCATVMRDGAGNFIGIVWVFRDATADRQLAAHLQAMLHEQEFLLREVHHRIKNNFQAIMSFLDLQAEVIEDPRALAALEESQQRLHAMALVHEGLYQSRDLDRMDGAAYLRNLLTALGQAYTAEARHLTLTIMTDTVELREEAAMPYGLILTELLTNAFKHAFPAGGPDTIEVMLHSGSGAISC